MSFSEGVADFVAEDDRRGSKAATDPFYLQEYNSSGGQLSQWEEEKQEEGNLEADTVGMEDIPNGDASNDEMPKNMMADENV